MTAAPYGERSRRAWAEGEALCAMCAEPAPGCRPDSEGLVLHAECAATWKGVRLAFERWGAAIDGALGRARPAEGRPHRDIS